MSWQIEIPIIVRTLINDWDANPTYSDERITQMVVVAAKYVQWDVNLDNNYIIDPVGLTITPDPVDANDDLFISLVSLKSACLVDQSTLRTKAAMEGIRAALGPANLSVAGSMVGIRMLLDSGPCASYTELSNNWDIQNASAVRAILSPFVGNKFDPRSLRYYSDPRDRTFYS
jgi:hypothetical protein